LKAKLLFGFLFIAVLFSSSVAASIDTSKAKAMYLLDSSLVIDELGINANGVNSGATTGVTGVRNTAYFFNSSQSDSVNTNNLSILSTLNGQTNVSICAWILPNPKGAVSTIFGSQENGGGNGLTFDLSANNRVSLNKVGRTFSVAATVTPNVWNHVCAVSNATTMSMWVNNTLANTTASTETILMAGGTTRVLIGARPVANVSTDQYFNGTIDEVFVSSQPFNAAQVNQLFTFNYSFLPSPASFNPYVQAVDSWTSQQLQTFCAKYDTRAPYCTNNFTVLVDSSLRDVTGNGNTLTNSGATLTDLGYQGQGYNFNTTANLVSPITTNWSSSGFTICAWNYKTGTSGNYGTIAKQYAGGGNNREWHLSHVDTGYVFQQYYDGANAITSSYVISDSGWNHVCGNFNAQTNINTLYYNGVARDSDATPGYYSENFPLTIGASAVYAAFNGSIDNVAIYNRSLSAAEVSALYNNQFVDPTGLVAYYPFDEITNSTLTPFSNLSDKSGNGNTLTNNGATWVGDTTTGEGYYLFNTTNYLNKSSIQQSKLVHFTFTPFKENSGASQYVIYTDANYLVFRDSTTDYRFSIRNGTGTTFNAILPYTLFEENTEYSITANIDFSQSVLQMYINGAFYGNYSITGTGDTVARIIYFGSTNGGSGLNGTIQKVLLYNKTMTASEVLSLYNNQTILSGLVAYYDFDNQPSQYNITVNATDYFVVDTLNQPITAATEASLTQAIIAFQPYQLFTNNPIYGGNITVTGNGFSQTKSQTLTPATFNVSAGQYNVTFTSSDNYPQTINVTVPALSSTVYNITGVYNVKLNVTARNTVNTTPITTFSVNVSSYCYGSLSGNTTNGTIQFNLINNTMGCTTQDTQEVALANSYCDAGYTGDDFILPELRNPQHWCVNVSTQGYFLNTSKVATPVQIQTNYSASLYPYGTQNVVVRKASDGTILTTQNTTLIVENTTTQFVATIQNGTANITGFSAGTYNLKFVSMGYANVSYSYTYNSSSDPLPPTVTAYLSDLQTDVTFTISESTGNPITGALIQVSTFVNGTMTLVESKTTDFVGQAVFNLQLSAQTYFIQISASGYESRSDLTTLSSNTYAITLESQRSFNFDESSVSSVYYEYTPRQQQLDPVSNFVFNWTVIGDGVTIEEVSIQLFNQTGTLLQSITNTTNNPSMLSLQVDLTQYNLSTIIVQYSYTKEDYAEQSFLAVYYVAPKSYIGSIEEARLWAQNNIDFTWRIFLWFFIGIICAAALGSMYVRGAGNALLTLGVSIFFGYLLAIPMLYFAIPLVIIAVYLMANSGGGI
jgi:hypothetical protein